MNESQFTRKIHKLLPRTVYKWKISDRYTAGIPDAYYSGSLNDLWVEYKYEKAAKRPQPTLKPPKLTKLQKAWLRARHAEGRAVATVIGYDDNTAAIIYGTNFDSPINRDQLVTHKDVATFIKDNVCGP